MCQGRVVPSHTLLQWSPLSGLQRGSLSLGHSAVCIRPWGHGAKKDPSSQGGCAIEPAKPFRTAYRADSVTGPPGSGREGRRDPQDVAAPALTPSCWLILPLGKEKSRTPEGPQARVGRNRGLVFALCKMMGFHQTTANPSQIPNGRLCGLPGQGWCGSWSPTGSWAQTKTPFSILAPGNPDPP